MSDPDQQVVEIRRYSNRRFYDTSQSKHVTLGEIRDIVMDGRNVRVTDASSGEDITPRVLTQIILEFDDEKMTAFPPAMLHRLIRSSESLLFEFVGQYFENATRLFQESQKTAGEQWQRLAGVNSPSQDPARWWKEAMAAAGPPWAPPVPGSQSPQSPSSSGASDDQLQRVVEDLRGQLESVQEELKRMREKSEQTGS